MTLLLELIYTALAVWASAYAAASLLLVWLFLRHRREAAPAAPAPRQWPLVTVQLPVYNDSAVVRRLLEAACALEYPDGRLEIQLLDDSTDGSQLLAKDWLAAHPREAARVRVLTRSNRSGYKAGALALGLREARGEFLAIFDSDFTPPADFLRRTIPHLLARPALGLVQTRWGYLNREAGLLTRAQAMALDGHFVIEQLARNRAGLFMNFNGSAGVWRKACLEAVGGWQADTLCEDLDASYRAQLAGWECLYLPDVVCPSELPPTLGALRSQQARWARGSVQCLRKHGRALLWPDPLGKTGPHGWEGPPLRTGSCAVVLPIRGEQPETDREPARMTPPPGLPDRKRRPLVRLAALLHLSAYLTQPLLLGVIAFMLPVLLLRAEALGALAWLCAFGLVQPVLFVLAQKELYPDWPKRLGGVPLLLLTGVGLAPAISLSALAAFRRGPGEFVRTPKVGDRAQAAGAQAPAAWSALAWEAGFLFYTLLTFAVAVRAAAWGALPWLALFAGGFAFAAALDAREVWRSSVNAGAPGDRFAVQLDQRGGLRLH